MYNYKKKTEHLTMFRKLMQTSMNTAEKEKADFAVRCKQYRTWQCSSR